MEFAANGRLGRLRPQHRWEAQGQCWAGCTISSRADRGLDFLRLGNSIGDQLMHRIAQYISRKWRLRPRFLVGIRNQHAVYRECEFDAYLALTAPSSKSQILPVSC